MALVEDHVEEGEGLELLDLVTEFVIGDDEDIEVGGVLEEGLLVIGGAFVDANTDVIEVFLDLCVPVIGDRGWTYYEIEFVSFCFASDVTLI